MFKNLIVYRIAAGWSASLAHMQSSLEAARFEPCGATQEKAVGWVEPRGVAHGALVESVGGQRILRLMVESKSVPASVIRRQAQDRLAQIESSTGRKPGKKETRDIKEDIKLALLPQAFARQSAVMIWLDLEAGLLLMDATSQAKADEALTALVRSLDGLSMALANTAQAPSTAMAQWLVEQEPPAGFSVDRECELKAADESRAVVRYTRHSLDTDEVRAHVQGGKLPVKLALTWRDRVSFVLTQDLQIKKIVFLEGVAEAPATPADEGFDADVAIITGELSLLLADLLRALGGEVKPVGKEAP